MTNFHRVLKLKKLMTLLQELRSTTSGAIANDLDEMLSELKSAQIKVITAVNQLTAEYLLELLDGEEYKET